MNDDPVSLRSLTSLEQPDADLERRVSAEDIRRLAKNYSDLKSRVSVLEVQLASLRQLQDAAVDDITELRREVKQMGDDMSKSHKELITLFGNHVKHNNVQFYQIISSVITTLGTGLGALALLLFDIFIRK